MRSVFFEFFNENGLDIPDVFIALYNMYLLNLLYIYIFSYIIYNLLFHFKQKWEM